MPVYLHGFNGEYENKLVIPHTLNHVTQFLGRVSKEDWGEFKKHVLHVKDQNIGPKIKPSSYKKLTTLLPHTLVKHVIKEK